MVTKLEAQTITGGFPIGRRLLSVEVEVEGVEVGGEAEVLIGESRVIPWQKAVMLVILSRMIGAGSKWYGR